MSQSSSKKGKEEDSQVEYYPLPSPELIANIGELVSCIPIHEEETEWKYQKQKKRRKEKEPPHFEFQNGLRIQGRHQGEQARRLGEIETWNPISTEIAESTRQIPVTQHPEARVEVVVPPPIFPNHPSHVVDTVFNALEQIEEWPDLILHICTPDQRTFTNLQQAIPQYLGPSSDRAIYTWQLRDFMRENNLVQSGRVNMEEFNQQTHLIPQHLVRCWNQERIEQGRDKVLVMRSTGINSHINEFVQQCSETYRTLAITLYVVENAGRPSILNRFLPPSRQQNWANALRRSPGPYTYLWNPDIARQTIENILSTVPQRNAELPGWTINLTVPRQIINEATDLRVTLYPDKSKLLQVNYSYNHTSSLGSTLGRSIMFEPTIRIQAGPSLASYLTHLYTAVWNTAEEMMTAWIREGLEREEEEEYF